MNIKINDFAFNTVDYREKMNQIESAYREKGREFENNILMPLLGENGFKEFQKLKETMLIVFDSTSPCLAPWKTKNLKERKVKVLISIDKREVLYIPVYLLAKCSLRRATDQDFAEAIQFIKNHKLKNQKSLAVNEEKNNGLELGIGQNLGSDLQPHDGRMNGDYILLHPLNQPAKDNQAAHLGWG